MWLKAAIHRDQRGRRPAGCPRVSSLSASLSAALNTYHPEIQSPSARDKFAILWALAAVDGAVAVPISTICPQEFFWDNERQGEDVELYLPSSPHHLLEGALLSAKE